MQYFNYSDKYAAVDKYMIEGGMAGSYFYKDQEAKYDYIADVFDTLIVRDIRKKYKIRNMQLMDRIVDFLMDNISNLSSARSITSTLSGIKEKVNHVTVSSYMQYLCNAFAFYKVRRLKTDTHYCAYLGNETGSVKGRKSKILSEACTVRYFINIRIIKQNLIELIHCFFRSFLRR